MVYDHSTNDLQIPTINPAASDFRINELAKASLSGNYGVQWADTERFEVFLEQWIQRRSF